MIGLIPVFYLFSWLPLAGRKQNAVVAGLIAGMAINAAVAAVIIVHALTNITFF